MAKKLLYLEQSQLIELQTTIKNIEGDLVEFEKTIIYPGGGGQPMDSSKIVQNNKEFSVLSAKQKKIILFTKLMENCYQNNLLFKKLIKTTGGKTKRF